MEKIRNENENVEKDKVQKGKMFKDKNNCNKAGKDKDCNGNNDKGYIGASL